MLLIGVKPVKVAFVVVREAVAIFGRANADGKIRRTDGIVGIDDVSGGGIRSTVNGNGSGLGRKSERNGVFTRPFSIDDNVNGASARARSNAEGLVEETFGFDKFLGDVSIVERNNKRGGRAFGDKANDLARKKRGAVAETIDNKQAGLFVVRADFTVDAETAMAHGVVDHVLRAEPLVEVLNLNILFASPFSLSLLNFGFGVVDKLGFGFPRFGKGDLNKTIGIEASVGDKARLAFANTGGNTDDFKAVRANISGSGRIEDKFLFAGRLAADNAFLTIDIGDFDVILAIFRICIDINKRAGEFENAGILLGIPVIVDYFAILPLGELGLPVVVGNFNSYAFAIVKAVFFFELAGNEDLGKISTNAARGRKKTDGFIKTNDVQADIVGGGRRLRFGIIIRIEISNKVGILNIASQRTLLVKSFGIRGRKRSGKAKRTSNATAVDHKVNRTIGEQMFVRLLSLAIKSVLREKHYCSDSEGGSGGVGVWAIMWATTSKESTRMRSWKESM